LILLGIDEAGYGPLLGPLVVSGTVFELPDAKKPPNLWSLLTSSVCKKAAAREWRLPVADSKKLFNREEGLAALERTALVMLATVGARPASIRELLNTVAPQAAAALDEYAWYRGMELKLPSAITPDDVATRANGVLRDMTVRNVTLKSVQCEVVPEGHFNRMVDRLRNKASLLSLTALRLAAGVIHQRKTAQLHVTVDRHGGRMRYADQLATFFEHAQLRIIEESDGRSAYELTDASGPWTIEFRVNGEEHSLPVALSSVYSKYLRELLMVGLNTFFGQRVDGLRATAGYYNDALRLLRDIEPAIQSEELDRSMLVRCR
jgi:ribonuclease HII